MTIKLVFGIRDSKVRERLLREKNLLLEKTVEICRSHETMVQQMRVVGNSGFKSVADARNVNAVSKKPKRAGNGGTVVAQEMLTHG